MIIPYSTEELLEINDFCKPYFANGIIVVDDVYKNYEKIHSMLQNMPVAKWKTSSTSKNFIEYYDCRATLASPFVVKENVAIVKLIKNLIKEYFNQDNTLLENDILDFGFYKNIKKDVPNFLQHFPHKEDSFNCLVYIDKICSGGTALFDTDQHIVNQEHVHVLCDVSMYPIDLITARPNRLVIFPGNTYHGAFIENHNLYVDNWRIVQLMFFNKINDV